MNISKKIKKTCGIFIEDKEGKVLIQLRDSIPTIPFPNRWGTFGGQIEKGETPEKAIRREIKEELDYDLQEPFYFGEFFFENYHIFMFKKIDLNFSLKDFKLNEGQEAKFFSYNELKELKFAFNCKELLRFYFKKLCN